MPYSKTPSFTSVYITKKVYIKPVDIRFHDSMLLCLIFYHITYKSQFMHSYAYS